MKIKLGFQGSSDVRLLDAMEAIKQEYLEKEVALHCELLGICPPIPRYHKPKDELELAYV